MTGHSTTADEFNSLLAQLGWSTAFLAYRKLGMASDTTVRRWRSGQNQIPGALADWLRLVAQTVEDLPPPKEWERRQGARRGPENGSDSTLEHTTHDTRRGAIRRSPTPDDFRVVDVTRDR